MTRLAYSLFILFASIATSFAADPPAAPAAKPNPLQQIEDEAGLPRVLIIGDSISIGYVLDVREMLKGKANVHRPPTNCGPTSNGVNSLDAWLAVGGKGEAKKWDVIHFNWGLHDIKYMDEKGTLVDVGKGQQQIPAEEYEKNLRELVERMKKTGATLIWCATTPVPEGAKGRVVGDEVKYNEIAARVMKEAGVRTNDLYAFAKPKLPEIQRPKDVHFTPAGSKALAEQVVGEINTALAERK